ncbi:hypothetical protein [Thalassobacillus pellis]|uniref:hypothetical protein n=1 Tax=Thalassobacillus pellis TaxID=748008 RepID=UPI00195F4CE2|nr:hypothetical protein [Thalassobacillus pellis]MBM7554430.1 DNA topoisomerase VI subunit B [Thalassobacillus pellis]
MMHEWIWKTLILFLALLVGMGTWMAFRTIDQQAVAIEKLEATIQRQEEQLAYFQHYLRSQSKGEERSEKQQIQETVRVFVTSVFQVTEDNAQERKANAKTVMTTALYEHLFPEGEKEGEGLMYVHDVEEVQVYTTVNKEKGHAYVIFEQTMKNLANGKQGVKTITMQLSLKRVDDRWKVFEFETV